MSDERVIKLHGLTGYKPTAVDWLWPKRIPVGELTIVAGDGGLGKSTFAAYLAGQVTNGHITGGTGTGRVVVVLGEDDPARVIAARYRVAGADTDKVAILAADEGAGDESPLLPDDLGKIRETVERSRPDLLIIDPLTAHLTGAIDAHRDGGKGGIRAVLNPLSRLAQSTGTAIVVVVHFNKGNGPASQRIAGSGGIRNAARNVLMFAEHPDARGEDDGEDDGRRIIGHDKCNYGQMQPSLAATITTAPVTDGEGIAIVDKDGEQATTSLLTVGDVSEIDYETAIRATSQGERRDDNEGGEAVTDATEFLRDELAAGPVAVKALKSAANDAGHSWRTVERAMSHLGVKAAKHGTTWVRHLPGGLGGGGLGGVDQTPLTDGVLPMSANTANPASPHAVAELEEAA